MQPDATLLLLPNGIAQHRTLWQGKGLRTFPVLNPGPNITVIRMLCSTSTRGNFTKTLAAHAAAIGVEGINLDVEPAMDVRHPANNPSFQDALDFAGFVDELAKALHARRAVLIRTDSAPIRVY